MAATIKPSEAKRRQPEFFEKRPKEVNWTLRVWANGPSKPPLEFVGIDWEAISRFGKVENVVVIDPNGRPLFDRPAYHEAPNINAVAWGRDNRTGEIKIALITEERPHANHPEIPESTIPLKFSQVPMGFLEKLIGKDGIQRLEAKRFAAVREVQEETGASAIRGISRPPCPWHNPSPSFVATWSELFFVEVDLKQIEKMRTERTELIYRAEYITVRELLARIREGQDEEGAILRGCTSLSILMIFFSCYPEFWPK